MVKLTRMAGSQNAQLGAEVSFLSVRAMVKHHFQQVGHVPGSDGNTGCGVFKGGIQNERFWAKNQLHFLNHFYFLKWWPILDSSPYTNSQNSLSWFLVKNLSILYPSLKNSTIGIAIPGSDGVVTHSSCRTHHFLHQLNLKIIRKTTKYHNKYIWVNGIELLS
jgi:hypothetical protein